MGAKEKVPKRKRFGAGGLCFCVEVYYRKPNDIIFIRVKIYLLKENRYRPNNIVFVRFSSSAADSAVGDVG